MHGTDTLADLVATDGAAAHWLATLAAHVCAPRALQAARLLADAAVLFAALRAQQAASAGREALAVRVQLARHTLQSAAVLSPDGAVKRATAALLTASSPNESNAKAVRAAMGALCAVQTAVRASHPELPAPPWDLAAPGAIGRRSVGARRRPCRHGGS